MKKVIPTRDLISFIDKLNYILFSGTIIDHYTRKPYNGEIPPKSDTTLERPDIGILFNHYIIKDVFRYNIGPFPEGYIDGRCDYVEIGLHQHAKYKKIKGRCLVDDNGNYYLGRAPGLGGNKRAVSAKNFCEHIGNDFYCEKILHPSTNQTEDIFIIGALDDQNFLSRLRLFVLECARLRRIAGKRIPGNSIQEQHNEINKVSLIAENAKPHASHPTATDPPLKMAAAEIKVESDFDPSLIEDERQKVLASIVRREGQEKFRNDLLAAYGGRCAISNCAIQELLEAAHIHPYQGIETNDICNGILLRVDLHRLFDLGLLAVDTENWTILISRRLVGSNYEQFAHRRLRRPQNPNHSPNVKALRQRRTDAGL